MEAWKFILGEGGETSIFNPDRAGSRPKTLHENLWKHLSLSRSLAASALD